MNACTALISRQKIIKLYQIAVLDKAWVACVLGAFQLSLKSELTASRAGLHIGDAGRVADPPHRSKVREHVPEEKHSESISPVRSLHAQLTGHDSSEISSYISTPTPRAGPMALRGRLRDAGRCRRGVGTPQRRNRAERRSEAGEIRRPKYGQNRPRAILLIGIFINSTF